MTEHAATIDDMTPPPSLRSRQRSAAIDPENTLKTLAKTVARDATADISDRHLRARVRTTCYNQLVHVLRQIDDQRTAQQQWYRRALTTLGSLTLLIGAAFALTLAL